MVAPERPAGVLGVLALVGYEKTRTTGSKVKDGDSVFVNAMSLRPMSGTTPDMLALKTFLDGFMATNVKVSNVVRSGISPGDATGQIIGFEAAAVMFPLSAVTVIDRNGTRIV